MNKKIMSLIIISMMMIVALSVVYADNGGCPCNVPTSDETKETGIENTKGDVQPLDGCIRSWIEEDCVPWYNDHFDHKTLWKEYYAGIPWVPYQFFHYKVWNYYYAHERDCEKWRVWYDVCQHKELYREYLGTEHETQIYLKYRYYCEWVWNGFGWSYVGCHQGA